MLKQGRNSPLKVEHQVLIIYAVVNNYLKDIKVEDIAEFQAELFDYVESAHPSVTGNIRETGDLSKETEEELKQALSECIAKFLKTK